jgi:hypothetical protein
MNAVPLSPVPSQTLSITLGGQSVQIAVFTLTTGLYFSLTFNGSPVVTSRLCLNTAFLIGQTYSAFQGDFSFVDTMPTATGGTAPVYTGLGTQYQLLYFAPSDFATGIAA